MLVERNSVRHRWAEYIDELLYMEDGVLYLEDGVQTSNIAVGADRKMPVFAGLMIKRWRAIRWRMD